MRVTNNLYNFSVQKINRKSVSKNNACPNCNSAVPSFKSLGGLMPIVFRKQTPFEKAITLIEKANVNPNAFAKSRGYNKASRVLEQVLGLIGIDGQNKYLELGFQRAELARKYVYIGQKQSPLNIYLITATHLLAENSRLLNDTSVTDKLVQEILALGNKNVLRAGINVEPDKCSKACRNLVNLLEQHGGYKFSDDSLRKIAEAEFASKV